MGELATFANILSFACLLKNALETIVSRFDSACYQRQWMISYERFECVVAQWCNLLTLDKWLHHLSVMTRGAGTRLALRYFCDPGEKTATPLSPSPSLI